MLEKISYWLDKISGWIITFMLILITVALAMQIFARNLLESGFTWTEELARFAMVWMIFFGAAVAKRAGTEIRVTVLQDQFPALRKWFELIQQLLTLVYVGIVIYFSIDTVKLMAKQTSTNMQIGMNYVYLVIPISFAIFLIHTIYQLFSMRRTTDSQEEQP